MSTHKKNQIYGDRYNSPFDINELSDISPDFQSTGNGIMCSETDYDEGVYEPPSSPFKELPADYTVIIL